MFTKEQRQILNDFSVQIYGSASRWAKDLANGKYRIPTGTKEVIDKVETVQFPPSRTGRRGQIMSRDKALEKKLITEEQVPTERTRQVQEFRDPAFEDLVKAFGQMVDSQKLSRLANDDLIQVLAYRYVTGGLAFSVSLITKEGEQYAKDLADSLKFCPEKYRDALSDRIATEEKPADGLPVDAIQFLTDVTFAATNASHAKELADDTLSKVDLIARNNSVPHQYTRMQTGDVVDKSNLKELATRRAKNKAAKASRKRNRVS